MTTSSGLDLTMESNCSHLRQMVVLPCDVITISILKNGQWTQDIVVVVVVWWTLLATTAPVPTPISASTRTVQSVGRGLISMPMAQPLAPAPFPSQLEDPSRFKCQLSVTPLRTSLLIIVSVI